MELLYQQLFEDLPCYVTIQDKDLRVVAANRLFRRDFGNKVGSYCYELYKGRDEKCPDCPVEACFADGEVHRSSQVVRQMDGRERWVKAHTAPVRGEDGTIQGVVEISADITDVKQLQQKFHALFEEVPCYISVQDRNLNITQANRRFRRDFGDGVGKPCYEVYKHREEPCMECPVAHTFQGGTPYHSEEVVSTKDGRRRNVITATAPIRDAAGEIVEVMEMSANITELRQVQDRLTSLGLLIGSVSHGIKGLLNGLDGGIYLMESGRTKNKPERVEQGWDILKRNVERIRSMVLNVLYYAKDRPVNHEVLELQELAASVQAVVASRAEQLGVGLEVDAAPGTFEADAHAVHAMLVNLLENSLDACRTDRKEVQHTVRLEAHPSDLGVTFKVSDNGTGMDRETREKAFSMFFSSKGAEGTGLGLFISHKIVKSHGGKVELKSEPGEGTTFIIHMPLKPAPDEEELAASAHDRSDERLHNEWDKALGTEES